ncbi:hypothetical protein FJZ31_24300 [Candidatus Poribacteria bacterium]|nr:hypothetical protein [Candidatus Poribacteria bacterium]
MANKTTNIFVASSVEGLQIARILQELLEYDFCVDVWEDGIFNLSTQPLERLDEIKQNYDFAIFVLTPDDIIIKRDEKGWGARDNVILELGFFAGFIGRKRCFMVHPRGVELFQPSDILGLNAATYNYDRERLLAALGPAANKIRRSINEILKRGDFEVPTPIMYYDFRNLPNYDLEIRNASERIWIQSLRIKGFLEDHKVDNGQRLLDAIKRGTSIRILLADPSLFISLGEKKIYTSSEILAIFSGEGKSGSGWLESVKRAYKFVLELKIRAEELDIPEKGEIEMRLHCSPITSMIYLIDDVMYSGPYLIFSEAIKAPTFRVMSSHPLYHRLINHFNDMWNDERLSRKFDEEYK